MTSPVAPGDPSSPAVSRRTAVLLAVMVLLFCSVVMFRGAVRRQYWVWRIQQASDAASRTYYLQLLARDAEGALASGRQLLASDDEGLRSYGVALLNATDDPDVVPLLFDAAGDPSEIVSEAAIIGLSMRSSDASTDAMRTILQGSDVEAAMLAVSFMPNLGEAGVSMIRSAAVQHPRPAVRAEAIETLAVLRGSAMPTGVEEDIDPRTIAVLIECLQDSAVPGTAVLSDRRLQAAATFAGAEVAIDGLSNQERAVRALQRMTGLALDRPEAWKTWQQAQRQ